MPRQGPRRAAAVLALEEPPRELEGPSVAASKRRSGQEGGGGDIGGVTFLSCREIGRNHKQIATATADANNALQVNVPGISLSRDDSYQLSNRIAYAWKLASMGATVLIYLGFIGDENIANDPHRLLAPSDWQSAFDFHSAKNFPVAYQSRRIDCGAAGFWLLVRSLQVLNQSPKAETRKRTQRPTEN
jgi:hypothetical protein